MLDNLLKNKLKIKNKNISLVNGLINLTPSLTLIQYPLHILYIRFLGPVISLSSVYPV